MSATGAATATGATAKAATRIVERADMAAVGAALGRAFQDDPAFSYFYPDPERRRAIAPVYFRVATALTAPERRTYTNADGAPQGAACFLPPEVRHVSTLRALLAAGLDAWRFGLAPLRRTYSVFNALEAIHPPTPHWYLMTLGVEPAAQGKGLAKALLAPVLAEADARGEEIYLETFKGDNVGYYERLGFKVRAEVRPDGGRCPPGWTMLRKR